MIKRLLLVLTTFSIAFGAVYAGTVSQQNAQSLAINFFKLNAGINSQSQLSASLAYTQTESDGSVDFYVFDMSPSRGFVIVSATDNALPVLGYSTETSFNTSFTRFGLGDWVKHAGEKIHYAVTNNVAADANIQHLWQSYASGINPVTTKTAVIGPLLKTSWNQSPYYNSLCPLDAASNSLAVTGCVATAMAQIMKYWNYPPQGVGSYSYNDAPPYYTNNFGTQSANFGATTYRWSAMVNSVNSNTSPVDTLMYHCGVAVAMDYGTDAQGGSGAFVLQSEVGGSTNNPCAQNAFANYFKYDPNTMQGVRLSSYSTGDWFNLMANELKSGRVIEYEGADPSAGGHTWVCDGYDNNNMLHMNWGWGGSGNGYFAIGNLSAGGYTFSQNDAALIGIQPLYPFTASVSVDNATICLGDLAQISAKGPASATYKWTPATWLYCDTCATTGVSPTNTTLYTCTIDSAGVKAQVSVTVVIGQAVHANFGLTPIATCNLPQQIAFGNASTNATNYYWQFGDGTSDTSSSPVHTYTKFGTYNVKLTATNACYFDTILKAQAVTVVDKLPLSTVQNICTGQTASLSATDTYGSLTWYNAATGGNVITTGTSYTTPPLTNTTTYYVDASITSPATSVGATDTSMGTGSTYTHTTQRGLIFNNSQPQTLVSVVVYASGTASRTITLLDSSGATINSATLSIASGKQTVPLNFDLPVANGLQLVIGGYTYLHRNLSGAAYPYISGNGNLVITANTYHSATGYYYFYDWQLQPNPCVTVRTAVPVFVLGTGNSWFSANGTFNAVSFAPADTVATSFNWNFGDGTTSTETSPIHAYSTDGVYTVQLVVSNGSCTDSITQSVNTLTLGINTPSLLQSLNIAPNPAKDQLSLHINSAQSINNCAVNINNTMGQEVIQQNIGLDEGLNTFNFNISELRAGIYFVTLRNGEETLTRRFVKQD